MMKLWHMLGLHRIGQVGRDRQERARRKGEEEEVGGGLVVVERAGSLGVVVG